MNKIFSDEAWEAVGYWMKRDEETSNRVFQLLQKLIETVMRQ